jgi:hypothetical protein
LNRVEHIGAVEAYEFGQTHTAAIHFGDAPKMAG